MAPTDPLAHGLDAQDRQAREAFETLYQDLLHHLLPDARDAERAREDGGFVLHGRTVVVRHDLETDTLECFCDVGQPAAGAGDQAWRAALEMNLRRDWRGLFLGLHPASGRLVATTATPRVLVPDAPSLVPVLEMLALQVLRLRESGALPLDDD